MGFRSFCIALSLSMPVACLEKFLLVHVELFLPLLNIARLFVETDANEVNRALGSTNLFEVTPLFYLCNSVGGRTFGSHLKFEEIDMFARGDEHVDAT